MPNKFIPPQTTTTTRTAATPLDGEILYDTDEKKLYYGDGTTVGGKAIGSPTVTDDVFRIQDNSDNTKQLAFETSGITTGTTRTLTVPDSNGTVLSTDTLTDKALYYYDASSKLFKPVGIGTVGQTLIAQPSSNPPYQWATPTSREVLTANRDYYISTTGSDSNNGLSAGSPFLTPQKFADVAGTLDRGIYTITGNFAAGTYSLGSSYLAPKDGIGDGDIIYKGDTSNPENVIFTGTNSDGIIQAYGLSKWHVFEGLKFTNTNNGHIFNVQYASRIGYKSCDFGSVGSGWHIVCANFGMVSNRNTASKITGGNSGFLLLFSSGNAEFVNATLTIQNNPAWNNAFVNMANASSANFFGSTVSGSATGKKFDVKSSSSLINSSILPGSITGTNDGTGHVS